MLMHNAAAPSSWDVARKHTYPPSVFTQGELVQYESGFLLISGTNTLEFRSLLAAGSDRRVSNGSWPVALFKSHCLSFPEMTFAVCLCSFSRSIFGSPVTHSIKGGQQISEISFSLTQRNQFRFQVILLSVHLWQLARSRGESTFLSVLSLRQDFLRPPEHTQSPAHFICTIHAARLSG